MAVVDSAKRKWAEIATVTLLVGETRTAFHVHEAALFEASPFFKAAFNSEFRESSDRTMTLPEDDEAIFEIFVNWVYRQRYDIPSAPQNPPSDYDRFMQPVQLFVLADKYDVRDLKNLIVSNVFLLIKQQQQQAGPTSHTVAYACEHTPRDSTIRKIFADYLTCSAKLGWIQQASTLDWLRNHPEISRDTIVGLAKRIETGVYPFYNQMPLKYIEKEK